MKWVLIAVIALLVIGAAWVRLAGHDSARWHVDPATVTNIQERNQHLDAQLFDAEPQKVAAALNDAIGGEVIAGDVKDGFATWVVRTSLVGYPDYV